ncbi:MAG: hypothetical protein H0T79_19200 [Deltaproteobacteria bacterium]|nr:hypothetical protein [Deltaproteobacteria bacterium]
MLGLAACGDDGGSTPTVDAPPVAASTVEALACPGGEAAEVTTVNGTNAFMPNAVTITAGQVVKFTMSSTHNVIPASGGDVNLKVNFSETKCLKFTAAGSFGFKCGPHQFLGTITVN